MVNGRIKSYLTYNGVEQMNEGLWLIFILALWIMAILLFRNLKMEFFKFIVGSFGIFAIGMIFFLESQ